MTFLLIGSTCAGILSVFVSGLHWLIKTVVMLCLSVVLAVSVFIFIEPATLGASQWFQQSPWWELLLFLVMLAGMMCRYITAAIEERRDRLRTSTNKRRVRIRFDPWEFSYPLFVSVITFGGVLSAISAKEVSLQNVILSFQTGFFWQTILASRVPTVTQGQRDAAETG
jgi:hypothetical protein